MSAYFEDLRELQHAIDGTKLDYLAVEQHNDRNVSIEGEERRQRRQVREMRKLAARHEIKRWNERDQGHPIPESSHQRVEDESSHLDQSKERNGGSSAQEHIEEQDARPLPSWAQKMLAVADQIEREKELVKKHKIHHGRLDKDGEGHQQYLATQQHLRARQMGSHQQQRKDGRSGVRNGSQENPQALQRQQDEHFEEVRSPASSHGSAETVVPWVEEHRDDDEGGAADDVKKPTRRRGKGKATVGDPESQEALASNGTTGMKSVHEAAERRVMQDTEIDRPVLDMEDTPNPVRHPEVGTQASPAEYEVSPPKAEQDRAQSIKLERKQQQKAARELRKKQRQEKRQEAKSQKMTKERRAEEEKKEEDEGFWQWLIEGQLANPNATVTSLSKERYLKEARQKKEREVREARRKKGT